MRAQHAAVPERLSQRSDDRHLGRLPAGLHERDGELVVLTGQLATEQQKYGVSYASIDPFGACP